MILQHDAKTAGQFQLLGREKVNAAPALNFVAAMPPLLD
jgi:hypothetical protein